MSDKVNNGPNWRDRLNNYESPVRSGLYEDIMSDSKKDRGAVAWYRRGGGRLGILAFLVVSGILWGVVTNRVVPVYKVESSALTTKIKTSQKGVLNISKKDLSKIKLDIGNRSAAYLKSNFAEVKKSQIRIENEDNEQSGLAFDGIRGVENFDSLVYVIPTVTEMDNSSSEGGKKMDIIDKSKRDFFDIDNIKSKIGLLNQEALYVPKVKCGWQPRSRFIYVDFLSSLDMGIRDLSTSSADMEEYVNLRRMSERASESFTFGVRVSGVFWNRFAIRSGIMVSTLRENFVHQTQLDSTYIVEIRDINDVVIGRDTVVESRKVNHNYLNKHRLVNIPIIVGLELDKPHYNFSINTGVYLNITTSHAGRILDQNREFHTFTEKSKFVRDTYRKSVGLSYFGSFGINYKFNPRFHILFEPYAIYYPNSFTKSEYILEDKYIQAGIQLGLRIKL